MKAMQVKTGLEKANDELANARKLILSGGIEPSEYRLIKTDHEKKITGLESWLMELSKESSNIELLLDKAVVTLSCLDTLYEKANNKTKERNYWFRYLPKSLLLTECIIEPLVLTKPVS